ncbi:hypothetical protein G6678_05875 [Polynucleobacter paneuropaeus]|jgi:hypothetical protein|nr:hypothetical protein G6713_05880 [Polynucleobacter paneuropaeus]QWD13744.1 hypothetical protein G6703_05820 [Polynucleobacter paneuropaeus]QWD32983.1 hypothetical protein G6678_05875 [Polynucleobacter paneuropaeus]
MSTAIESNLIIEMSQAYNSHFMKNSNTGEALLHMMESCQLMHPKLRNIDSKSILALLSHGKTFSNRAQLRNFAVDVIVYLIEDVVGSKYSRAELTEATQERIKL